MNEQRNRGGRSAHHKRMSAARQVDRRRFAPRLPRVCFWCGCALVRVADIPRARRRKQTGGRLHYLDERGELVIAKFLTIDHVIPFKSASDLRVRTRGNIVASCFDCNHDRTALPKQQRGPREFGPGTFVCSRCRGPKTLRRLQLCDVCFAAIQSAKKKMLKAES